MIIMIMIAFMFRFIESPPLYYLFLLMAGIVLFMMLRRTPSLYMVSMYERELEPQYEYKPYLEHPEGEPLPEPTIPVAPKPLIVSTRRS